MKNLRKSLIALSVAVFGITAAFGVASVKTANADTTPVAKTAYFRMADGASIKNTKTGGEAEGTDTNGIRFQTEISDKYVAENAEALDGATFFTLLSTKTTSVEALTYGTEEYKVEWTNWEYEYNNEGQYTHYTALYNFPEEMFTTAFTARSGYVTADEEVVYATGTESRRTMEGVALAHIAKKGAGELEGFGKYVGMDANDKVNTDLTVQTYGENRSLLTGFKVEGVTTSSAKVYNGARLVEGASVVDGTLKLPSTEINGVGNLYTWTDGETVYQRQLKTVHFAIGTPAEMVSFRLIANSFDSTPSTAGNVWGKNNPFNAVKNDLNPETVEVKPTYIYAALTAHIDMSKCDNANTKNWKNYAWFYGCFDGQGYTFVNFTTGQSFLARMYNATIKNLGFVNFTNTSAGSGATAFINHADAKGKNVITNVYVQGQFTKLTSTSSYAAGLVFKASTFAIDNVVLNITANVVPNTFCALHTQSTFRSGNNIFAISNATKIAASTGNEADLFNYGLFADTDALATAIEDEDVSMESFENNSFWNTEEGYPVWANLPNA